jgi:hypothetical protein
MDSMVTTLAKYQRQTHSVCAYGILLYGPADVYIRQIIDNDNYCDALDAVSGSRWTIFFARVPTFQDEHWHDAKRYVSPGQYRALTIEETKGHAPKVQEQQRQEQMQQMQQQQSDWAGIGGAQALLRSLGLDDSLTSLPQLLVVVPIDSNDAYVRALQLKADTADEAYQSLRRTLLSIGQVFEGIASENLKARGQGLQGRKSRFTAVLLRQADLRLVSCRSSHCHG